MRLSIISKTSSNNNHGNNEKEREREVVNLPLKSSNHGKNKRERERDMCCQLFSLRIEVATALLRRNVVIASFLRSGGNPFLIIDSDNYNENDFNK